jgi:hypothetical protein
VLIEHLAAVEHRLLCSSKVPGNAGHAIHKGTAREAFIREFLLGHIGTRATIGTGEIIDASSIAEARRNQIDIVVSKSEFPKIELGGGLNAFLAESVTIEVKSRLTKAELRKAVQSASVAKKLERHLARHVQSTAQPMGIVSIVVAYDGPKRAAKVHDWLTEIDEELGLNPGRLDPKGERRSCALSGGVDGVFVLGRSSVVFDYDSVGVINDVNRRCYPDAKYQYWDATSGNLLWLFMQLTHAVSNAQGDWPVLQNYLKAAKFEGVQFGPKKL